jgi:hypothetical protein
MKSRIDTVFAAAAGIVVCAALAVGVSRLGSPAQQRESAADTRRVEDLRAIAAAVYYRRSQNPGASELPGALSELPGVHQHTADPVTLAPYEFKPGAGAAYELCAVFATDGKSEQAQWQPYNRAYWSHPKGRYCFALNAKNPVP